MISIIGREMNEEYGCIALFCKKKMKPQLCFSLKKPSLVINILP